MASEDEFRKVAEEIRALAKSLARDFRDAVDQSRASGRPAGEAVRDGLKGVANDARRNMKDTLGGFQPRPRGPRSRHRYWAYDPRFHGHGSREWHPSGHAGDAAGEQSATGGAPPAPPWVGGPRSSPGGRYGPPPYAPFKAHPRSAPGPRRSRRRGLPPVRHRWDSTTIIGALAVVFGVAWMLDAVNAAHISVEGAVAVGLMLLGAAMIVTGRTDWSLSRRSWPVFAGAALVLVLIATSTTFGAGSGSALSFGNKNVSNVQSGQTIQGGFGNLTVDTSQLSAGDKITIQNLFGNINVTVPGGIPIRVKAHVLGGLICINGHDAGNGVDASVNQLIRSSEVGAPLVLDVHEVAGRITIGSKGCNG